MPDIASLLAFAAVALGMVLTPGPNMVYLVSRSICQGRAAGLISLCGVALGFVFYMLCAAFGITTLLLAIPYAYDVVRAAGALYLLWLAWQAVRPGGRSPFEVRDLPEDGPRKLFLMGFLTNVLNPKIAVMYLSLLPQFIDPAKDGVLGQALALGSVQIVVSVLVNAVIATCAASIAGGPHPPPCRRAGPAMGDGHRPRRAGGPHGDRRAAMTRRHHGASARAIQGLSGRT